MSFLFVFNVVLKNTQKKAYLFGNYSLCSPRIRRANWMSYTHSIRLIALKEHGQTGPLA